MTSQRVIILGHTGFVGKALFNFLKSDDKDIHGFSSSTLDLRRFDSLSCLDPLIHNKTTLIFTSALTPDKGATLDVLKTNLDMSMNLAKYLEKHPVEQCIYLSTDAVYPLSEKAITETSGIEPSSFNALAKYAGERILNRVSETTGLPLLILRLNPVYGFGDTHGSYGPNLFMRSIFQEKRVRLFGDGEDKRDHLYINDAVRLIAHFVQNKTTGLYNLAMGQSYSFAKIVEILQRSVPFSFSIEKLPRKVPLTHRHFDVSNLLRVVPGFRYTPVEEALQDYVSNLTRVL
ncbi:MAG: NAD(P)-dependent oxidoreductase [Deltaproteobacteria bacterium]|nr:NAD(P)-dependent oxidoreductase [Deltaproteobacteria bacterium]